MRMKFRYYLPASIIYFLPYAKSEDIQFMVSKLFKWELCSVVCTLLAEPMGRSCLTGDRICRSLQLLCPNACVCQWYYHLETSKNKILVFLIFGNTYYLRGFLFEW